MAILRKLNLLQIKEIKMDNITLEKMFFSIMDKSNGFDRYIALKKLNKEYKKTDFYKKTKMNIRKAYELFVKDGLIYTLSRIKNSLTPDNLGEYLTNLLDNIQPDAIEQLTERIIQNLNLSEITSSTKELGDIIHSFKH